MASSAAGKTNPITSGRDTKITPPPPYWTSAKGKGVVSGAAVILSGAYFGGCVGLHTFFLEQYMSAVHLYKYGFHTPLTPGVVFLCQEVLDDMRLKMKASFTVRYFSVFGFDMFHAGSTKLRGGAIVGIPRNFSYESEISFEQEKHEILVENKTVEWGTDGGRMLKDALYLSERARKFAIAREIAMADTHSPYIYGMVGPIGIIGYHYITKYINERFRGFERAKSFRVSVYTLVATFAFGVAITLHDSITKYYEKYADNRIGNVSLEYAKGGVEFYSKVLQRNMALRSLMGPSGEKTYTYFGNDVETIRQRHVPFTDRKRNLELIAEKLAASNSNLNNNDVDKEIES